MNGERPSAAGERERSSRVSIGHSAILNLVGVAASGLLGLAVTVVVSRRLGYDDLGLYSMGLGGVLFLSLVTRMGLDVAVLHFSSVHLEREEDGAAASLTRNSALWSFGTGTLGAILLWLAAPLAGSLMGEPRLDSVLRAFAPAVPFLNLLHVADGALRGAGRVARAIGPRLIVYPVTQFGAVLLVLLVNPELILVVYGTVAGAALASGFALYSLLRTYPSSEERITIGRLARFGAGNLTIQVLHYGVMWTGLFLLAWLMASADAGYFRVAAQTSLLLAVIPSAFETFYGPVTSRLLDRGDTEHLNDATQSSARITFYLTATAALPMILAPEIVLIPFGPNVGPAVLAFAILAAAQSLAALLGPAAWILIGGERLDLEILANIPPMLLVVGATIIVVPLYGVVGAAAITAVAIVLRAAFRYHYISSRFGVTPVSPGLLRGLGLYVLLLVVGFASKEVISVGPWIVGAMATTLFLLFGVLVITTPIDRETCVDVLRHLVQPGRAALATPAWDPGDRPTAPAEGNE